MNTARPDEPVPPEDPEAARSPEALHTVSPGSPSSSDSPSDAVSAFPRELRWGLALIGALALLFVVLVTGLVLTATPHGGPPGPRDIAGDDARGDRPTGLAGRGGLPAKTGHEDRLPSGGEAFSDGEGLVVGEDIRPGTYRQDPESEVEDSTCFYVIYADVTEATVLRTGADDYGIAVLEEGEVFDSVDCGDWLPLEDTVPQRPAESFGTGMFVVGEHVEPGTYELDWDQDTMLCWWDVFRDLRGPGEILDSGFVPRDAPEFGEPLQITLGAREQLVVSSEACGTWTRVS